MSYRRKPTQSPLEPKRQEFTFDEGGATSAGGGGSHPKPKVAKKVSRRPAAVKDEKKGAVGF